MNENNKQAKPVAADHTGLIKRIDAAIERVTQGRGLMSIPADPRSDVDLVLSECKALLQGENPPFWATDFHPAQPVALDVGNLEYMGNSVSFIYQKMRAYKDGMGKVWQALRDNGIYPDGQTHAADAIRKALAQPAQPVQPAVAVNEQMLEALKSTGLFLHHCWCDVQMNNYSFEKLNEQMQIVDAAIAAAEQMKRGVCDATNYI